MKRHRQPCYLGCYHRAPVSIAWLRLSPRARWYYLPNAHSLLTVLKAGGAKPEVLHEADFGERILATPAIVDDKIYLRTENRLWAFGK